MPTVQKADKQLRRGAVDPRLVLHQYNYSAGLHGTYIALKLTAAQAGRSAARVHQILAEHGTPEPEADEPDL